MTADEIDYDLGTRARCEASCARARRALQRQSGCRASTISMSPSDRRPGVALSKRLKEQYPEEMTIVLQHRFWDLIVTDERFEVKLTFDGIPERLVVPFSSHQGVLRSDVALRPAVRQARRSNDWRASIWRQRCPISWASRRSRAGRRSRRARSTRPRVPKW